MLSELYALSSTGTWGNAEKFKCYLAFLLIVPNKTVKGERVFGLVVVWAQLLQACHPSLGDVAHKLRLLIITSNDWVYAFAQLNEGMLHMPLSIEGHISVMINGAPSMNACGCLSQLEVGKLLQCGEWGTEWGVRTHVVHLSRTHTHQAPLQDITPMGQPLQHDAKQRGTYCLDPP